LACYAIIITQGSGGASERAGGRGEDSVTIETAHPRAARLSVRLVRKWPGCFGDIAAKFSNVLSPSSPLSPFLVLLLRRYRNGAFPGWQEFRDTFLPLESATWKIAGNSFPGALRMIRREKEGEREREIWREAGEGEEGERESALIKGELNMRRIRLGIYDRKTQRYHESL